MIENDKDYIETTLEAPKELQIDCTAELFSMHCKQNYWLYKRLALVVVLYLFFLYNVSHLSRSFSFFDLFNPAGELFEFNIIFLTMIFLPFSFMYGVRRLAYRFKEKALELSKNKKLIFEITAHHIRFPILMLDDQALWKATKKSCFEIIIPFEEIIKLEAYPLNRNLNTHYWIMTQGESEFLSQGTFGIKTGFKISRLMLKKDENVIFDILKQQLENRLEFKIK